MQENVFWQYSLAVYSKPAVAAKLLDLQDRFHVDVNMVLCCCWLGSSAKLLLEPQILSLLQECDEWAEHCVRSLRSVRQFLKSQAQVPAIYESIKSLELEAERWQQGLLYTSVSSMVLVHSNDSIDTLILNNLQLYTRCLPALEWEEVVNAYKALLEQL